MFTIVSVTRERRMKIRKILVANRGEIALRIIRTAKEMGIMTVAVYSDADKTSLHVREADEAVHIGPSPSNESYLKIEKIIEAAKSTNTTAVHPGYGFLSENAVFAREVEAAGLIFIGPSPSAIQTMGSKLEAKRAVSEFKIPLVPGTDEAISDPLEAMKVAKGIGYPILIKASAGGGGKGMRVVNSEKDLKSEMQRAQSEALSAFGDDSVFIEKFITSPRHIEFQIVGDSHGNIVHLFERECSVQRRHQKVVEEAPSSVLSEKLRDEMGAAAINVARACNYIGAGTVEFIMDQDLNYYFLEMNTRLQVEHPVTEEITGIDLVREQINIAAGNPLSFSQENLSIRGHSIELRVYAEDPENSFLPSTGTLSHYNRPQGPGIRVDDGFEQGMDIPVYYDPMIAKLVATASNREAAMERMIRAIKEYKILGIQTTLPFGAFVMQHEAFQSGNFDTNFVGKYFTEDSLDKAVKDEELQVAALMSALLAEELDKDRKSNSKEVVKATSAWRNRRNLQNG